MELFWKKSECTAGFKIRVWDAVVRAKLCFGLESAFIPKSMREELNAFHRKGVKTEIKDASHLWKNAHRWSNYIDCNNILDGGLESECA